MSLGDKLNSIVITARNQMFLQGELAQLSFMAFGFAQKNANDLENEEIEVHYPVGYNPDKTIVPAKRKYTKQELADRYQYLSESYLGLNAILQLVTITEAMCGDVLRAVIVKYPKKLGNKRQVLISTILESNSIEEMHLKATDSLINELTYKSPEEFAAAVEDLTSINLLECTAYHRYIEVKATRDIYLHNSGVANQVYLKKSGTHARAKNGQQLPMNIDYFLESYESCIQLSEWLELELHEHWHSQDLENRKAPQLPLPPAAA